MSTDVRVVEKKPWLLEVWEPLKTKAPNPNIAQPYCCYVRTVIFYVRPYVVRPWHRLWESRGRLNAQKPGQDYERWDQIEYALTWNDPFEWNGQRFEIGGGTVIWKEKRWWMRHWARRKREEPQ